MVSHSVSDLFTSPRRFDLFPDAPAPDDILLTRGVHPPLLLHGRTLLWGHHLLRRARLVGISELSCVHVEGDDLALLELVLRAENRLNAFSWSEIASLSRLADELEGEISPREEAWSRIESLVLSRGSFRALGRQYRSLPAGFRELVSAGKLELRTAVRVQGIAEKPAARAATCLSGLSRSSIGMALGFVDEIRMRDGMSAEDVSDLIQRASAHSQPVDFLRRLRYPSLSAMEQHVQDVSRNLAGLGLEPPKHFEGDAYSVSFLFRSPGELERRIERLNDLKAKSESLFELLR